MSPRQIRRRSPRPHRADLSTPRLATQGCRSRNAYHGVTFRWKDYRAKDGAKGKTRHKAMTLSPHEFMRRFLLHVLPGGFHRIRHYGLLANGHPVSYTHLTLPTSDLV